MCLDACMPLAVSEDNLWELVLSSHHMGHEDWTQVISLYLMSYLTSSLHQDNENPGIITYNIKEQQE